MATRLDFRPVTQGLDHLISTFLDEYFAEHPTMATGLGLDGYDDRLDDLREAGIHRREEHAAHWLGRFNAVPDHDLTIDERIDRDLITSVLRGTMIRAEWQEWRRQPAIYINEGLDAVFGQFLHRIFPDDHLAASASACLRQIPDALAAGRANLDPDLVPPVYAERALAQCDAAIRYTRDLVALEVSDPDAREMVAEAGEIAARAYEDFRDALKQLHADARGSYAIGEQMYSSLLTDKEMLSFGARELRDRGRAEFETLAAQMAELARDIDGTDDWRRVVERLTHDHPSTPEAMRDAYEEWTERARGFLRDRDLVTLPEGERCLVEPSPPFERPVLAVASYHQPPAFKPSLTGHFFVPYPPDGVSDDEIRQRLSSNSFMTIPTTSVHEAYPGHHWHLIVAGANPRPARKVFGTAYFWEGWALYSEIMMREEGFYTDPKHLIGVADARLFRAARIIVDTSLHLGEMHFDEAVAFMRDNAGLSEPTARAEVGRYCSWPTQASSYLTGSLEIEAMRARYLARNPGDLRGFHDKIAASGSLPLGLAERALAG